MYDIVIIGAGIIGMATAMKLTEAYPDKKLLLVDKESSPAMHQTGHNSGVIHAGVYYKPDSLKARFCQQGNELTKAFCRENDIPYNTCGKMLVATTEREVARMRALWQRTEANGLERYWLNADQLAEREPNIKGLAASYFPATGIVDYRQVTEVMARKVAAAGAELRFDCPVTGIDESSDEIVLHLGTEAVSTRHLVVCAGLMADRMVRMIGVQPRFRICPFRGEYYQLTPANRKLVKHLIYPVPDPATPFLGVHLTRTIDGSITVGPNAVLALKREGYHHGQFSLRDMGAILGSRGTLKMLAHNLKPGLRELKNSWWKRGYLGEVRKYCPQLTSADLKPYPAGVRAQAVSHDGTLINDFLFINTARSIHVCNAPSPAATSALPIASYIVDQATRVFEWNRPMITTSLPNGIQ